MLARPRHPRKEDDRSIMATLVFHFLSAYFMILLLLLCLRVVDGISTAPISSCRHTPYPEVCNYFMAAAAANYKPTTTDEDHRQPIPFRAMLLRLTLAQAERLHELVSSAMDSSSIDEPATSAWLDCFELYEDTIDLLNRSIGPAAVSDSQTWLSAAVANQQTCLNGFFDLNPSSDHHHHHNNNQLMIQSFPSMSVSSANFSKLLSNSLAINRAAVSDKAADSGGGRWRRLLFDNEAFPTWVSPADRKLLLQPSMEASSTADIVVARDGSGDYTTISESVAAAVKVRRGNERIVIQVKAGVYRENVEIRRSMKNIMVIGEGKDATIVTGNKNVQDGSTTFRSATFAVWGDGFIARDMTFENTAGPHKHQAVALRSSSDGSVFYRCSFKGYQDTLYLHSRRQFYRDCDVYGTVDFIFGDAAAVLQHCNIYVRRPMSNQANTITAQGRSDPNENTGISIHDSRVVAAPDLRPVQTRFETYLGRPWREYSRTVFMKTFLDGLIHPAGWRPWSGDFGLRTLYYGEYMNSGRGGSTNRRVNWPGYRVITRAAEADKFTVGRFLAGDSWIPTTGIPYASGL